MFLEASSGSNFKYGRVWMVPASRVEFSKLILGLPVAGPTVFTLTVHGGSIEMKNIELLVLKYQVIFYELSEYFEH